MSRDWKSKLQQASGVAWCRQGTQLRSQAMEPKEAYAWAERLSGDGDGRVINHGGHMHVLTTTRNAIDWANTVKTCTGNQSWTRD